jgi:hypothetical protein
VYSLPMRERSDGWGEKKRTKRTKRTKRDGR